MDGCPHCKDLKDQLEGKKVPFVDRNIDKFKEEYENLIVKETENEYLPAVLLIEQNDPSSVKGGFNVQRLTPDDNFTTIEELVEKITEFKM